MNEIPRFLEVTLKDGGLSTMANRFDTKEFNGRDFDSKLKEELEEKVKQFLFDEGCYGSTAVANVIVELMWVVLGNKAKK